MNRGSMAVCLLGPGCSEPTSIVACAQCRRDKWSWVRFFLACSAQKMSLAARPFPLLGYLHSYSSNRGVSLSQVKIACLTPINRFFDVQPGASKQNLIAKIVGRRQIFVEGLENTLFPNPST